MTRLERKQDELIRHFNNKAPSMEWYEKKAKLESELAQLKQESKESEMILVDDPHFPNMGQMVSRKEYEAQFKKEQESKEYVTIKGYRSDAGCDTVHVKLKPKKVEWRERVEKLESELAALKQGELVSADLTPESLAQWVIDNRYPKSELDKISDSEMYYHIISNVLALQSFNASQQGEKAVSDEEINKWAYDESEQNICGDYERGIAMGKNLGAVAMRDGKIKQPIK